ncbi:MAG TPA: ribosomal-protein-alanine N-acetyltransferase [Chloroflexi bacterium]|nr:ribosomal-protein-alanine N-acetyltransferase [Chloroflexota bacterium]
MRLDDLDEVMEIERAVFPMPWSLSSYRYELTQNDKGYYLVARLKGEKAEGLLLGYGGFWLVQDEAHICTLAVRPGWRRKGLGELILISLLDWAVALGANVATLEVRISNRPAQKLYSKYGFKIVGRRKRYYANQEDALIMTAYGLTSPPFQGMLRERRKEIRSKLSRLKEER